MSTAPAFNTERFEGKLRHELARLGETHADGICQAVRDLLGPENILMVEVVDSARGRLLIRFNTFDEGHQAFQVEGISIRPPDLEIKLKEVILNSDADSHLAEVVEEFFTENGYKLTSAIRLNQTGDRLMIILNAIKFGIHEEFHFEFNDMPQFNAEKIQIPASPQIEEQVTGA